MNPADNYGMTDFMINKTAWRSYALDKKVRFM